MVTIIPSSKIYNIENKKIIDNKINEVNIKASSISKVEKYSQVVGKTTSTSFNIGEDIVQTNKAYIYAAPVNQYNVNCVAAIITTALSNVHVLIPGESLEGLITKINTGVIEGNDQIRYSVIGDIKYGSCTVNATFKDTSSGVTFDIDKSTLSKTEDTSKTESNVYITPERDLTVVGKELSSVSQVTTTAKVDDKQLGNYRNDGIISFIDGSFKGDITAFSGGTYYSIIGSYVGNLNSAKTKQINGTYKEYVPKQVEMSFYGDIITLDIKEKNETRKEENANGVPISFSDVNLSQGGNYIDVPISSHQIQSIPLSTQNADDIMYNYYNGKETAIIECNVGGYFVDSDIVVIGTPMRDPYGNQFFTVYIENFVPAPYNIYVDFVLDGNNYTAKILKGRIYSDDWFNFDPNNYDYQIKQIRKELMFFNMGDIVIPMVYTNNGDVPMSTKKDGSPKEFRVVANKINYDGHITQELTLQEV